MKIMLTKKFFIITLPILFLILSVVVLVQTKRRIESCKACQPKYLTGEIKKDEKIAFFEGRNIPIPELAFKDLTNPKVAVLGVSSGDRWIDVDLSEQKMRAYEGNNLFLESLVSSGLPWWPTPTGVFNIWTKLRATRMEGGEGKYYYNLPNVPYVMYFYNDQVPKYRGYGLHGTYWHNDFGRVHSHGCVNLPTAVAEKLYYWTSPVVPSGKSMVYADEGNPGTKIVIHN